MEATVLVVKEGHRSIRRATKDFGFHFKTLANLREIQPAAAEEASILFSGANSSSSVDNVLSVPWVQFGYAKRKKASRTLSSISLVIYFSCV